MKALCLVKSVERMSSSMRDVISCLWWAGRWSRRPASLTTALAALQWCCSRILVCCGETEYRGWIVNKMTMCDVQVDVYTCGTFNHCTHMEKSFCPLQIYVHVHLRMFMYMYKVGCSPLLKMYYHCTCRTWFDGSQGACYNNHYNGLRLSILCPSLGSSFTRAPLHCALHSPHECRPSSWRCSADNSDLLLREGHNRRWREWSDAALVTHTMYIHLHIHHVCMKVLYACTCTCTWNSSLHLIEIEKSYLTQCVIVSGLLLLHHRPVVFKQLTWTCIYTQMYMYMYNCLHLLTTLPCIQCSL